MVSFRRAGTTNPSEYVTLRQVLLRVSFPPRDPMAPPEQVNDWGGGRGCHNFVPVLRGDDTKIAPIRDLFGQPPGEMS